MGSYTIQAGDTLDAISAITGASVSDIENNNSSILAGYGEGDDLSALAGTTLTYPNSNTVSSSTTSSSGGFFSNLLGDIGVAQTSASQIETTSSGQLVSGNPSMSSGDLLPNSMFTLGQLSATQQNTDNTVSDPGVLNNLDQLAIMLTELYNTIGPFQLLSAYRSEATNESVISAGNPGSSTSFHLQGIAADLAPTQSNLSSYFSQIITSPFASQLGEIYLKESQGSIHVSLSTGAGNTLNLVSGSPSKTAHAGFLIQKPGSIGPESAETDFYTSLDPYTGSQSITIPAAADFSLDVETEASDDLINNQWIATAVAAALLIGVVAWAWTGTSKSASTSSHAL